MGPADADDRVLLGIVECGTEPDPGFGARVARRKLRIEAATRLLGQAGRDRTAARDDVLAPTTGRSDRTRDRAASTRAASARPRQFVMCSCASSSSASRARHRSMTNVVPPRRSAPGSLVMNPRWANDVPLGDRPPPSHVSPTSVLRDERELPVAIQRALRQPRRTRREDDRDRAVGIVRERFGCRIAAAEIVQDPVGRGRRRELVGVEDDAWIGDVEHRGAFTRRQAVVHARGDRAELRGRAVRKEVLRAGRKRERDDVTGARLPGATSPAAASPEMRSMSAYDSAQPTGVT